MRVTGRKPNQADPSSAAGILDRSLRVFFWRGARVSLGHPRQAWRFAQTVRDQAAAARRRATWAKEGVRVPPIIIFSITHQCNLECAGCYARSFHAAGNEASADDSQDRDLDAAMLADIVSQADDLGTGFFVIAGGEPLLRPEILDVASDHPNVLFLLLTNGTLLVDDTIARLGRLRNVILLLSLEGGLPETDERRGQGTYERLTQAMARLRREHAYFGCSVTLTRANYPTVLEESYIADLVQKGIRFFLFLDYTPTDESTRHWVLSGEQREHVETRLAALKKRHQALFVAVPWDELAVGGCLSAGRGFVHINASGDVEPCPFAPYSDANLRHMSLLDALRSPFLARLRGMPGLSTYSGEGCALWKNREDVQRVLAEVTAKPE